MVKVVNKGETMIVGVGTVTGIMIEIVAMSETETESPTAPAAMNQEVVGGHALDPESELEIMIDIGTGFPDCIIGCFCPQFAVCLTIRNNCRGSNMNDTLSRCHS